ACIKGAGDRPGAAAERAVVATEALLNSKRRTIASPTPFVPPPVGANDPDFLAAQLLAQGFEYRHLVGDAIDAIATGNILLHYGIAPEAANDTVERHLLVGREGVYLGIGKALDQLQRLHHRAMVVVIGAELQGEQEFERHAAIVSLV